MGTITRFFLVFILSAVGLLAAVNPKAQEGPLVKGMVTRVLEDRKLVMVKHEEIPGVMGAMTMAFAVPEGVWGDLKPGTYLTGTLQGGRGEWRLANVSVTDRRYNPLALPTTVSAASDDGAAPSGGCCGGGGGGCCGGGAHAES